MSWRAFAEGLVGALGLATPLEIPLQWYLPGGSVEEWPSIDRGSALSLSPGGPFLGVSGGALAARLNRTGNHPQAVATGKIARFTASPIPHAVIGDPAAAVLGSQSLFNSQDGASYDREYDIWQARISVPWFASQFWASSFREGARLAVTSEDGLGRAAVAETEVTSDSTMWFLDVPR